MFCPECGKALEEGVVFCFNCGTKVRDTFQTVSPVSPPIKKPLGIVFIGIWNAFWGLLAVLIGRSMIVGTYAGLETLPRLGRLRRLPLDSFGPFDWREEEYERKIEEYERRDIEKDKDIYNSRYRFLEYIILLGGMFEIAVACGIWSFARWGRNLTIIVCILSIPLAFLLLPIRGRVTFGEIILTFVGAAISAAIIFYLSKTDVKRLFQ